MWHISLKILQGNNSAFMAPQKNCMEDYAEIFQNILCFNLSGRCIYIMESCWQHLLLACLSLCILFCSCVVSKKEAEFAEINNLASRFMVTVL